MNPKSGENISKFEPEAAPEGQERQREQAMEKPQTQESAATKKQIKDDSTVAPPVSVPLPPTSVASSTTDTSMPLDAPTKDLQAHEGDLIEKQWVARAKAIVHQTQDDPYVQKREISKAGADYIKKRFNKTIPTDGTIKS